VCIDNSIRIGELQKYAATTSLMETCWCVRSRSQVVLWSNTTRNQGTREIGDVSVLPTLNQVKPAKLPTRSLQQGQKLDVRR
jgi:hypothetical protein